jgi:hypothetical protein
MATRRIDKPHLWAPTTPAEPRLLSPGELDYPSGLVGQQQEQPLPERGDVTVSSHSSCLQWERAVLGAMIEQPLADSMVESRQAVGERYLSHLWSTHSSHFGSTRPAPVLVLTDELRADTRAQYLPEPHLIKVRPGALTRHALVHECCHAWTNPHHGPEFALGMLYLLEYEFRCDRNTIVTKAQDMGLPINAWTKTNP